MSGNLSKNPKGEISQKSARWKQCHSMRTHGPTDMSQAVANGYAKTPKKNLLYVDNPCKELLNGPIGLTD
jgi:hypothetical protein